MLTLLRFEVLVKLVEDYLLIVIIAATLGYQLLRTLWLQWIGRRYADDAECDAAERGTRSGAVRPARDDVPSRHSGRFP